MLSLHEIINWIHFDDGKKNNYYIDINRSYRNHFSGKLLSMYRDNHIVYMIEGNHYQWFKRCRLAYQ